MKWVILLLFLVLAACLASAADHARFNGYSATEDFSLHNNVSLRVNDTAVYNVAHYSTNGTAWVDFPLSGEAYPDSTEWIAGEAAYDALPAFGIGEHYVIIYSCTYTNNWDCHGGWQLHVITNQAPLPEGTLYLAENGVPVADIVVAPDAPSMVGLAADYFQMYLEDMSGATLPISNNPDPAYDFHVYIGQSTHTDALGITCDTCRDGGFRTVTGIDHLVLLGDDESFVDLSVTDDAWDAITAPDLFVNGFASSRSYHAGHDLWELDGKGSMNAVHDFLYGQGMRWYYPNDIGTVTPDMPTIGFQAKDETTNPDFPMRDFYLYYKRFGHLAENIYPEGSPYGDKEMHLRWVLSLGGTSTGQYVGGSFVHGLNRVTGREETVAAHPEYYATWDGNFMSGLDGHGMKQDLCSEELLQATIRYVKHMIDTYGLSSVGIMPADGFTRVSESSQECLDMATPERGGSGSISDYVWDFTNDVAWAIHDDPAYGPDKMIVAGAYTAYQLPPISLSDPRGIAPNIEILLTKWRTWTADPEQKQHFQDLTDEWISFLPSGTVYTYDYYLFNRADRTTADYPAFFPHLIDEDLKFLKGKSRGEFIEIYTNWPAHGYEWDTFAANGLNTYVTARLYWDVDQDVDILLDEYYDLFYGPANDEMKALVEYSEANVELAAVDPLILKNLRGMAEDALAIAETDANPVYAQRINVLLGLINARFEGYEVLINTCQDLTSPATTYMLTQDITADGDCFLIDADGVTLDCQGYTITYASDGVRADDHAIRVVEGWPTYTNRGDYFNITNCRIQDGSYLTGNTTGMAILISGGDNGYITDTFINTSGGGIQGGGMHNTYKRNEVHANTGNAFFAQYGSYNSAGPLSFNVFEDNYFGAVTTYGGYFYRHKNDTIVNNMFYSRNSIGLHMHYNENMTFIDNTFMSDGAAGLRAYGYGTDTFPVFEGNTQIDG